METIFSQNVQLALLVGPKQCGKTTLSFKIAYDAATKGGSPLYVCRSIHTPAVCKIPENNIVNQKAQYQPEVLDRIRIKFAESIAELTILMSSLHLFSPPPSLIVIDDLMETIKGDAGFESLLFASAILQNASKFLNGEYSDAKPVTKILTVLSSTDAHIINALKRYHHALCHIERTLTGRTIVKVNAIRLPLSATPSSATSVESERNFYFTMQKA